MTKRQDRRRQRNRELAAMDAKHRCGYCRAPVPKKVFLAWGDQAMYCTEACRNERHPELRPKP